MKRNNVVATVDGQAVTSLSHLVELLENRDGESHRILLEDTDCEIVLRHEDVDRRSQEILDRYRIPSDRSPDLMALKSSPTIDPPAEANNEVTAEVTPDEPPASPTSAVSE